MPPDEPATNPTDSVEGQNRSARTPAEQAASLFGTTPASSEPPKAEAAPAPVAVPGKPAETPAPPKPADSPPAPVTLEALQKAVDEAQTPEAKAAAEKALEEAKAAQAADAPITLEALKVPEGLVVPEEAGKEFLGILNDKTLKPADMGQKLLDLQAKLTREASEKGTQAWNDLQATWQEAARNDAEIGGDRLDPALAAIDKSIDSLSKTPEEAAELRKVFDLTGFGNNPHGIRFLHRLVEAANVTEGRPAMGAPHDPRAGKTQAQVMYPNMGQ